MVLETRSLAASAARLLILTMLVPAPAFAQRCYVAATVRQIIEKMPEAGPISGMTCSEREVPSLPGRTMNSCERTIGKVLLSVIWDDPESTISLAVSGKDLDAADMKLAGGLSISLLQSVYSLRNTLQPTDFKQRVEAAVQDGAATEIAADFSQRPVIYHSAERSVFLTIIASSR